jgi:aspartyl-tRNA(Asn)/glutamyl-tRNA(Gln) amidotransferase subunit C
MSIDRDEVKRIADLARLEIPEDEVAHMAEQLSTVLDFVATLDALDLSGCEPTAFAPPEAPLRPDAPDGRRLEPGAATAGAPESEDDFFLVPPIVENLNP